MDNMKARCWYEATFPLYDLTNRRAQELVTGVASRAVNAAEWVASCTRNAIKDAWFSAGAEVRGNLGFIDATYWSRTEGGFYSILGDAVQLARNGQEFDATAAARENWRKALIRASEQLFDENAASADIGIANPKRIADAHKNLLKQLQSTKLKQLLALAPLDQIKKRKNSIEGSSGETGAVAE
jgi:CRISPR system Cascade subunit CasA